MADQANEGLLSPTLLRQRIAAARPFLSGRILDVGCGSGALAAWVPVQDYLGVEPDEMALAVARAKHPNHAFRSELPMPGEFSFDTIVALAVIEHVEDPKRFLRALATRLAPSPLSRVVLTTPHPSAAAIHRIGANLGIFSRQAAKEHKTFLGRSRLAEIAEAARLHTAVYRRFLFGLNQLAVLAAMPQ
jgi:2-polyprenyl-3-methyl-5-hydroxy-6-metoxy-1,4-benzoquinol methylase